MIPSARAACLACAAIGALALAAPAEAIELGDGDPPITLEIIESLFADWHFDLEDPQIASADDQDHVVAPPLAAVSVNLPPETSRAVSIPSRRSPKSSNRARARRNQKDDSHSCLAVGGSPRVSNSVSWLAFS